MGADWEQRDALNSAELLSTSCYRTMLTWGVSVSTGQGSFGFTFFCDGTGIGALGKVDHNSSRSPCGDSRREPAPLLAVQLSRVHQVALAMARCHGQLAIARCHVQGNKGIVCAHREVRLVDLAPTESDVPGPRTALLPVHHQPTAVDPATCQRASAQVSIAPSASNRDGWQHRPGRALTPW